MRMYRSLTLTWTRERGERFQTQTPVPTPIVPRTKMTVRTPKLSSAAFVARPREPSAKTPPTKKKSPPRIQLRPGESSTKKLVDASQNRTICRSFRKRAYLRLRSVFILRKTARALMISVDKPATWLDHSLINTSAFFPYTKSVEIFILKFHMALNCFRSIDGYLERKLSRRLPLTNVHFPALGLR
jgi:hypothetical protein